MYKCDLWFQQQCSRLTVLRLSQFLRQVMLCLRDGQQSLLLQHMLLEMGAEVALIASEAAALACVRASPGRWHLLLDERHDLDFCLALQAALAPQPDTIICTLLSTVEARRHQAFIEAGFSDFMAGPLTHSDLLHLIGDRPTAACGAERRTRYDRASSQSWPTDSRGRG